MINGQITIEGQTCLLTAEAQEALENIIRRVVKKALVGEDLQVTLTDQRTGQRDRIMFKWDETLVKKVRGAV